MDSFYCVVIGVQDLLHPSYDVLISVVVSVLV